jgi:alpha-glucosidase
MKIDMHTDAPATPADCDLQRKIMFRSTRVSLLTCSLKGFIATFTLLAFATAILGRGCDAQSAPSRSAAAFEAIHNGLVVRSSAATLRITALTDQILRVQMTPDGKFPEDASWAVLASSRERSIDVQPVEDAAMVGFRTASLQLSVARDTLRLVVTDLAGNVISADAPRQPTEFRNDGFTVSKTMPTDEHYFGLGDKTGSFDRRDQAFTLWNRDFPVGQSSDPTYKSIPFFLAIGSKASYGLFLDNTWRSWFDFGKRDRDVYSFGAEGGPLNYYLIYGPTPKQVLAGYISLTGTPPLPPLWSLGFQQSRYSYTPESQLVEVAKRLRADKIPSDALYLDIDYQDRDRPFTVNPVTFPDFSKLITGLRRDHFHLVTITDLHIADAPNQGYTPYDSGHAGDHFVKNPDGSEFVGKVWPGAAVFPDFTQTQARQWWGSLYKGFVDDGVAGFWNDMDEPAVFDGPGGTMPLNTVHRIEEPGFATRTATHAEVHNIFGMENERGTYDGVLKLRPNERPFVLTRATYAGGQRYGFTWTGDNSSTWNQLHLATQMLMNLGLSGISMVGDDIGGFLDSPSPELLTRWFEVGAFNAMYRDHTCVGTLPQEVWVHGPEQEAIRRHYIETRYRLLPYIYTLAEEASRDGMPLVRPLFLEFPGYMAGIDSEFLLGPDLLVAPPEETVGNYQVHLPPSSWFDFWTGLKVRDAVHSRNSARPNEPDNMQFDLPKQVSVRPALDVLPVYVRGGSILPMEPLVQSTDETPIGPLELRVYPGQRCEGSIYLDDGHTFQYRQGDFLRQAFTCTATGDEVSVQFSAREGKYAPWWKTIEVVIYDWPSAQAEAHLSGSSATLNTRYDTKARALHIVIPDIARADEIRISAAMHR